MEERGGHFKLTDVASRFRMFKYIHGFVIFKMTMRDIVSTIEIIFVHEERRTAHARNFSLLRPELGLNGSDCRSFTRWFHSVSCCFHQNLPLIFANIWWRCCKALSQRPLSQPLVGPKLGDVERLRAPKPGLAKDGPFHRLVPGGTPQRFLEVGNVRNVWYC